MRVELTLYLKCHFVSRLFNLPLRTDSSPKGIYTEEELYSVLALIFITIFLDVDPVRTFPLRQAAKTVSQQLCKLIETNVSNTTGWGLKGLFFDGQDKHDHVHSHGSNLIKGWSKEGMSTSGIVTGQILPTIASMVPSLGIFVRVTPYPCQLGVYSTLVILS